MLKQIACFRESFAQKDLQRGTLYHVIAFPARTAKGSGTHGKNKEGHRRYSEVRCSLGSGEIDAPLALLEFVNFKLQELPGSQRRTWAPVL